MENHKIQIKPELNKEEEKRIKRQKRFITVGSITVVIAILAGISNITGYTLRDFELKNKDQNTIVDTSKSITESQILDSSNLSHSKDVITNYDFYKVSIDPSDVLTLHLENGGTIGLKNGQIIKYYKADSEGIRWAEATVGNQIIRGILVDEFPDEAGRNSNLIKIDEVDKFINKTHVIVMPEENFLVLRTRPLSQSELNAINTDRSTFNSQKIESNTFILGLENGCPVELLGEDGSFYRIKTYLNNQVFEGYIAKRFAGTSTLKQR